MSKGKPILMKQYCLTSFSLLFLFIFSSMLACTKQELDIGLLAPLSGPNSQLGVDARDAAELFFSQTISGKGLGRFKTSLHIFDDENDLDAAASAIETMKQKELKLVIGPYLSAMIPAIETSIQGNHTLFLSPSVSLARLSGLDDFFLRTYPSSLVQADFLSRVLISRKHKKVALVYDTGNQLYALPLCEEIARLLQNSGIDETILLPFTFSQSSHSKIALEILKAEADAVVFALSGYNTAQSAQQIRKLGLTLNLYGSNWPQTQELIEQGGSSVEGMVLVSLDETKSPSPASKKFADDFYTKFGRKPGFSSYLTYEALMVLDQALEHSRGKLSADKIKVAILKHPNYEGLQHPFTVDKFGDAAKEFRLIEIKDGSFIELKPES